ncbi:MAG: alcohol dehydrogenase catalytic domain-containing protein [Rhodobacteraceae bacterium]|nr:alcohol dehydrogenase catalytic domain-containing protein [Paracoccaceae bacterium]
MKALVYTAPETLEFRDEPPPAPQNGESLVSVDAVGICGSDMHAYLGHDERRPAPLILGHEAMGTLDGGRRVTVNPLVTCQTCDDCRAGRDNLCASRQIISMPPREGGFAEALAIPERNLVTVPDGATSEAAALTEPIACGWHAVRLGAAASIRPLDATRCLVYGGGAIGLGAALVLAAHDADEIWLAETHPGRRSIVENSGEFRVFDPRGDSGPAPGSIDLIIDGVGLEVTRRLASSVVRPGGVIVHIGLGSSESGLDIRRMTLQEITFIGAYTYTPVDFRETAQAIFDGRLGKLDWPEIRPLCEGARAFEDLKQGCVAAPKIILKP